MKCKYNLLLTLSLLMLLSSSCVRKKNLPQICAEMFKPLDSISVILKTTLDTLETKSFKIVLDTTTCTPDSITKVHIKQIKVEVPKYTVITKTVSKDSIIYRSNTARETYLSKEYQTLQGKYLERSKDTKSALKKANNRWWIIAALITLMGGYTGLRIFNSIKQIPKQ